MFVRGKVEFMRVKHLLLTAGLAAGALTGTTTPAHAIGGGNCGTSGCLTVRTFYSDASHTNVVGQLWNGCPGQFGSWGTTSGFVVLSFPPCGP
jgi:hypothetical protein